MERSREGRNGKAVGNGQADDLPQGALVGIDFSQEEIVEQEIIQLRILVIGFGDLGQKFGLDDAAGPENGSDGAVIEVPVIRFRSTLVEGKALGIGDDLGRIQALADGFDEVRAALGRQGRRGKDILRFGTAWCVGHDAGIAGCRNHGNIDTLFHRFDARPAAGPLLTGGVYDLIQDLSACFVVFGKNIRGDTDEEALQFALVPFMENLRNGGVIVTADVFEQ